MSMQWSTHTHKDTLYAIVADWLAMEWWLEWLVDYCWLTDSLNHTDWSIAFEWLDINFDWPTAWLVVQNFNRFIVWLVDWLIDCMAERNCQKWLIYWWLTDKSID